MSTRFYQHILPGDDLGKVTRLKYIDDISDDELILYYFEDGSKCSSEFIADVEEENPIQAHKVMVTLAGSNYPWVFERKEVVDEKSPIMKADDGIMYEAPTPGTHLGGMGQNRTVEKFVQEGIRTEVRPPRRPAKYTLPPLEDFYLSLHPELEYGGKVIESTPEVKKTQQKPNMGVLKKSNTVIEEDYTIDDFDAALSESEKQNKPVSKKESVKETVEETVAPVHNPIVQKMIQSTNAVIDIDSLMKCNKVTFKINGKLLDMTPAELVSHLTDKSYSKIESCIANEDVLIKNMIDKSKKKACKITMGITLELPPKEVYDTIKSVYEEGMTEQFVQSLTARIPQDSLLKSLANGLSSYYDKNDKKSASNVTSKNEV